VTAGNPDDYRFKPGEIVRYYKWTPEEILAAKAFVLEQDPPLWEALKALELKALEGDPDLERFSETNEGIRLRQLLKLLHPQWDGRQLGQLWGNLRILWRSEITAHKS
jgi:hypothetical protein